MTHKMIRKGKHTLRCTECRRLITFQNGNIEIVIKGDYMIQHVYGVVINAVVLKDGAIGG